MTLDAHKQAAQEQWTKHPCGFLADKGYPDPSYFESVDHNRYVEYAPWMPETFEFSAHGGEDVLEIGFGQGTDLFQFAKHGARVTGVDLSRRHLDIARTRFERVARIPACLLLGDGEQLPFRDASFDYVHSFGVLHHSPDMPRSIAEIRRILRPGGRFMVGLYYRWSAFHLFQKILTEGLGHGVLRSHGYAYLMATVELGGSETLPLVRTYSRGQLRRLFRDFAELRFEVRHIHPEHFGWLYKKFKVSAERAARWESTLGWYVLAKGRKALVS